MSDRKTVYINKIKKDLVYIVNIFTTTITESCINK